MYFKYQIFKPWYTIIFNARKSIILVMKQQLIFVYVILLLQVLTKRLKHSNDKYKDLQVDYDELKMISEKVSRLQSSRYMYLPIATI